MALGRIYTGAEAHSRRQPMPEMRDYLRQQAHRIKFLSLQGYLAVDGIEYVIRRMRDLAPESDSFILDMHQVEGISQSAASLLNQARMGLREENIAVVFSRLRNRKAIAEPLSKAALKGDHGFLSFEDNDLAVEWCENRLLGDLTEKSGVHESLMDNPLFKGVPADLVHQVESITHVETYKQGEQILSIGQEGDGRIFFIIDGQVSILVPVQESGHQRIASLGPGMNFGEMALLGQTTRSASVYADTDVKCRVLETDTINKLAERAPQLKISLLENLSNDLANKLRRATKWISALA